MRKYVILKDLVASLALALILGFGMLYIIVGISTLISGDIKSFIDIVRFRVALIISLVFWIVIFILTQFYKEDTR